MSTRALVWIFKKISPIKSPLAAVLVGLLLANPGFAQTGDSQEEFIGVRTRLAEALGQYLLAKDFQPKELVAASFKGRTNSGQECRADLEIEYSMDPFPSETGRHEVSIYTIRGIIQGKSKIYMQPYMPVEHTIETSSSDSKLSISYDSEGPCTGGIFWGASCDRRSDVIEVERSSDGNISKISLSSNLYGISPHPDFWTKTFKCNIETVEY